MNLSELNQLTADQARETLTRCCGSSNWVEQMTDCRPFLDQKNLFDKAAEIWNKLADADWLEAFSHHPRIGGVDTLKKRFASTKLWSEGEQSGVDGAEEEILEGLAKSNDDYYEKFGYIFIVCATGRSAGEMLEILKGRLGNSPDNELKIAASEQSKITRIRLEKLLS